MERNEIQQRIDTLKLLLLELAATMQNSDSHAAKCQKMGLSFQETYPSDYEAYMDANISYNATEQEIARMQAQLDSLQEEAQETGETQPTEEE